MSDPSLDDEQIELASAYVDDALDGSGRARAEADPAVMELVDRFRAGRAALAEPITAAPDEVDRVVATAMSAYTPDDAASTASVVRLAGRRRARGARLLPWAAAAAATAIVALGVSQLDGGSSSTTSSDVAATAAQETVTEKAGAATTAAASGRTSATTAAGATSLTGGAAAAAPAANRLPDLGAVDDTATLAERARAVASPSDTRDVATNDTCRPTTTPAATLTYQGRAAQLFLTTDADGRRTAFVIATPSCEVLAETLLP
ncbi:MAG: hypothetical protein AB7L13_01250 [Acidimicrobiia bacterium]